MAGRSAQTYEKLSFFSIFSHLDPFPQAFGQVKKWIMLELHKIIRVLHLIAPPIIFILFYERSWQGRVLKVMEKDDFLVFLAVWIIFPKFLGSLMNDLY